jgi:hypothetical protein
MSYQGCVECERLTQENAFLRSRLSEPHTISEQANPVGYMAWCIGIVAANLIEAETDRLEREYGNLPW